MYLKIQEENKNQFTFNLKKVIGFASIDNPINPKFIASYLRPDHEITDPSGDETDNFIQGFGFEVTVRLSDFPEKICYCFTDEDFRIIEFTGNAFVVNDKGDTINRF